MAAPERRYVLFTDDESAAIAEVRARREASSLDGAAYRGWDMGDVRFMENPPLTAYRYCVFQIKENK